jgi:broad specificity phosphatase PhoE
VSADARWIFLRHAETEDNVLERLSDDPDAPLSADGEAQAAALADLLGDCGAQALLCSPSLRARRTAAPLAHRLGLDPTLLPALAERRLGALAGQTRAAVRAGPLADRLTSWELAPPDGESLREVAVRALRALAEQPPLPVRVVVTHSGVLRAILGVIDDTPEARRGELRVPHAAPIERCLAPGALEALRGAALVGAAPRPPSAGGPR